jgi:hypothetical protein
MKLRFAILILATMCMSWLAGCDEEDTVMTSQRSAIENYLKTRKLVSRKVAEQSGDTEFYDVWGLNTYRYISTMYAEGRDEKPVVEMGDEVALSLTAYIFSGSQPRVEAIYFTNDQTQIDRLVGLGLNTEFWNTDPVVIRLGSTDIIKGVEKALVGCHEGDAVEVYMTKESAYGKQAVGIVPKDASIAWYFTITSVKKR